MQRIDVFGRERAALRGGRINQRERDDECGESEASARI
jgi:hypothetical protein